MPALAALLGEERTTQAARYALEGMPFPEAVVALRQALRTTSGPIQAGLIDSEGWRRDAGRRAAAEALAARTGPPGSLRRRLRARPDRRQRRHGHPGCRTRQGRARSPAGRAGSPAALRRTPPGGRRRQRRGQAIPRFVVPKYPDRIRVAAWRGLVMADASQRANLVTKALAGGDRSLQIAALKVVRELNDAAVVNACLRQWTTLPAESQLAVLDARLKLGGEVLPAVHTATQSSYASVRIAAWLALGDLGDAASIPALAKAAAASEGAERDAARDTLARLRGPGVHEALIKDLAGAAPGEKAELLRALGDRGDATAADVLVQNAAAGPERGAAGRAGVPEKARRPRPPSSRCLILPARPSRTPTAKPRSKRSTPPATPARTKPRPPAAWLRPSRA